MLLRILNFFNLTQHQRESRRLGRHLDLFWTNKLAIDIIRHSIESRRLGRLLDLFWTNKLTIDIIRYLKS